MDSKNLNVGAHTHSVGAHTHSLGAHTHSVEDTAQ
ncbi:hypothetical protein SCL04_002373 [Salmonella enterica]|nr:hypothetical protein [Salmonella enterica subsp. enterica serovar Javiana]EAA9517507.1 hypothetical protein [Salmonella enterica]EBS0922498.1 hypothetical protein [Salmonella enterica subsp. enterica serovar Enteritidis]EBV3453164.1 hypothetical protein [Salmonella enterica subsp. enterica serovar Typhimurium]EBW2892465.1 hypothetical protein [Salmonella enterica subsp. enterica serovar Irumu]EBW6383709.1 hypothetical protein [Salmonella enterica subsp. enterica serovar Stanley]EBW9303729.